MIPSANASATKSTGEMAQKMRNSAGRSFRSARASSMESRVVRSWPSIARDSPVTRADSRGPSVGISIPWAEAYRSRRLATAPEPPLIEMPMAMKTTASAATAAMTMGSIG